MLVCSKCKGLSVQFKAWVDANTGIFISDNDSQDEEDSWCADCEEHVKLELVTEEDG